MKLKLLLLLLVFLCTFIIPAQLSKHDHHPKHGKKDHKDHKEKPEERHGNKHGRRRNSVADLLAAYYDDDNSEDDDDEERDEWLFELQDVRGSCNPNPCLNNGVCEDKRGRFKCKCPKPFKGRKCERGIKACKRDTCGYGQCVLTPSPPYFECKCIAPFQPPNCRKIAPCELNPCLNGGTCEKDGQDFDCICKTGFSGKFCQVGPNDCYKGNGESYRGTVSETEDGHECLFWNYYLLLSKGTNPFKSFNDPQGLGPHNYCRNPDGESKPWCFTRNGKKIIWDHCDVRKCPTDVTPITPLEPKPITAHPPAIHPVIKPTPPGTPESYIPGISIPSSDDTGSHPAVSGDTGRYPAVSGDTGRYPAVSGDTGKYPAVSGDTGSHPAGSGDTGSHPAGSDDTGSHAAGSDDTGSHIAGSGDTGSHPAGSDDTGSHIAGSGDTGSLMPSSDDTGSPTLISDTHGWHPAGCTTPGSHTPEILTTGAPAILTVVPVERQFATCGKPQPKRPVNRIYGGMKALPGGQPWQASVQVRPKGTVHPFKHVCGGTLIKPCWLLTAGHCIDNKRDFQVVLGTTNLAKTEPSQQTLEVVQTIIHEQYRETPEAVYNDIALLRLKDKNGKCAKESQFVKTACLPSEDFPDGTECTISGWGATPESQYGTSQLLDADVLLISHEICSSTTVYGKFIDDTMFCAGYLDGGVDSCQGDSGGPLTCVANQTHLVYGIVSWGDNCGVKNKPGVYTRVTRFVDWINRTTARVGV